MEQLLIEAREITHQCPDDETQGRLEITLTTGLEISGRIDSVDDGLIAFVENEHSGSHPDFPLFVRIDHIVTFQYV